MCNPNSVPRSRSSHRHKQPLHHPESPNRVRRVLKDVVRRDQVELAIPARSGVILHGPGEDGDPRLSRSARGNVARFNPLDLGPQPGRDPQEEAGAAAHVEEAGFRRDPDASKLAVARAFSTITSSGASAPCEGS